MACAFSLAGVFIQFFTPPHVNAMLLVGKLINGYALGIYVSGASGYCAELSPLALRGITTGSVNLWIVSKSFGRSIAELAVGQFLSNCVIEGAGGRNDKYAYRIPL